MNDEDPCSQCGSTEFNLEDDGRTYCANGHDQGRGVITGEDEADFGRLGKVVRKKVPKTKVKASKSESLAFVSLNEILHRCSRGGGRQISLCCVLRCL